MRRQRPKVKWLSPLRMQDTDGERCFVLLTDFRVQYGDRLLVCPKGMITDGGSIPRFFWRVIGSPWCGKHRRAVVLHDGAYSGYLRVFEGDTRLPALTRVEADRLLDDLNAACGVAPVRRRAIYAGVRVGGCRSYRASKTAGSR